MRSPSDEYAEIMKDVDAFEESNPQIAEAMRIFGISMRSYTAAIEAEHGVRTITSNCTEAVNNAHLDRRTQGD